MSTVVLATGVANVASVEAALRRAGEEPVLSLDLDTLQRAERLVLPGVGHFEAGMRALREAGVVQLLRERIAADRPTLAICLGLQLLALDSEEAPGVPGLGVLDTTVRRLPQGLRLPHLGWTPVAVDAGARWLEPGHAAFAHSYALREVPEGWTGAWAELGTPFVAAVERGAVLACQFHPELSGAWGASLLERWLADRPLEPAGQRRGATGRLTRRVLPCLDVRDGRVVKGVRFQGLRDAGDPAERAAAYARQGADELVVLDVSATPEGRDTAAHTVAAVRAVLDLPLTVGGGVRRVQDAARLLGAGADKVATNSAAVERPELLAELARSFGVQCVVLALDAARRQEAAPAGASPWEVVVHSGKTRTGLDAVAWARRAVALGAGEILLTSWDRDGTRSGYDLELLTAVSEAVDVPVVASGGADRAEHLAQAVEAGAEAVLAASIFHDGDTTVADIKRQLAALGIEVRP